MNKCVESGFNSLTSLTCYWDGPAPHKYWYDILMGFKTELLVAYAFTLVFILVWRILCEVRLDNERDHVIKKMETENERFELSKGDCDCDGEDGVTE